MRLNRIAARGCALALPLLALSPITGQQAVAMALHNVPQIAHLGADQGRVAPETVQSLTVFLTKHNEAALDQAIADLYDPSSASYHQWLSDTELSKYAPTAAEFKSVQDELVKQGFSVLSTDPLLFSIRVRGTVANIEKAFQTQLHSFTYQGKTFQAHVGDAQLTGAAGALVASVAGLDRTKVVPGGKQAINAHTGKPLFKPVPITASIGSTLLGELTDNALSASTQFNYITPGAKLPTAQYTGSVYDSNYALYVGFTPAQLQAHYGLTPLLKQGYDGLGQTIALVEGYGYPTAEQDANVAAKIFGLPLFNASNFRVEYPEGLPFDPDAGALEGWDIEIAIDIQSAHAIAPAAHILEVATSGQDNEDFLASIQYVVSGRLAHTVSNSWGEDIDLVSGPEENDAYTAVLKQAAAVGISVNFATGDSGDNGVGSPIGAAGVPANNPYATGVGGTSILNNPYGSGQVVTGWGTDLASLAFDGVEDPPLSSFYAGSGGGESVYFAKPSWQSALPGTGRQTPDVSALADPYTGFEIVVTQGGVQTAQPGWGGTSLACPIFSAIWAIADQYNGSALGDAAPLIAKLKAGQILDVVPALALSYHDASGTVTDSSGTTKYTHLDLFADELYSTTVFASAVYPYNDENGDAITFGLDSSLTVTTGWDNVTGFGEPNGLPFVQGVTGRTKGAPIVD